MILKIQHFRAWYNEYQKFVNGGITKEKYNKWTFLQIEAKRFKESVEELRKKKKEK